MSTFVQALCARLVARARHCVRIGLVATTMIAAAPALAATPVNGVTTFGTGGNYAVLATGSPSATATNARGSGWDVRVTVGDASPTELLAGDLFVPNTGATGDGILFQSVSGNAQLLSSFDVSSNDASLFDLKSFAFTASDMDNTQVTLQFVVIGYRNHAPVPGATANFSLTNWMSDGGVVDVSSNPNFAGVDEFRVTGNQIGYFGIDNLTVNNVRPADSTPPTVSALTSSTANGTYKTGDVIAIQVLFSEPVTVVGTPRITLETGATDRNANYSSGSGSATLTFTYVVQAGDTTADLDVVGTTALALNGGSIRDGAGNNAVLTLPVPGAAGSLGASKAIVIDGIAPVVASVSSSTANGIYKVGDVIAVNVNLSEAVAVTGTPQLTLETGTTDRVINYASGGGTSTLTFNYTVQAGDTSVDLDYVSTAALTLNGGTIRDAAGNNASLVLAAPGAAGSLGANKSLVIDAVAPTVGGITVSGSPPATATSVTFSVAFSESVDNVSTDDFTLAGTGTASGTISSVSASSGSTIDVTVAGIVGSGTLRLNLNGGTNITDVAGNGPPAAYSAGATHTVAIPTAPGAPTIGAATAGDALASVSFTAPASDGGSAITGYTVTSSPGAIVATGASSPIVVTGLTNGTSYTFTVTATNAVGDSVASSATAAVTPKALQTITFNNPGSQNFGTSPTLTATASSGLAVTFSATTTAVCSITSGGALTFVSAGTCTIDADQAGDAATTAATTVSQSFTVNAIAPGAPTIGLATAGDTQAAVTFAAPASNGGSTITGYTVTSLPGGITATGAGSPITVTGLTNGVAYTFTVTAMNAAGTSAASVASNAVTPAGNQAITFANPGAQLFGTSPTLTATSTSGLPVSFSSATPAVCAITTSGVLTFVASGACSINADQSGDAAHLPAPQVSRTFTVNADVPSAPLSVTAVAGNGQVSVSFAAPASAGGAPITGYTVTSSPGGITATGAGSPIVVTGLANGTSYTFTVVATNSAGAGAVSAPSNAVMPAPPLAVAPVNATVAYAAGAYAAGATPITLDILGTATAVAVASTPSHGTAIASGTTITYQPASGYAGPDSFTYTATDGITTTAPATVTVTVSGASVSLDATALTNGVAGTAYTHTFAASGGAAPYAFALIGGALPNGVSLASSGVLSGTPTQAGTFNVTVQAIDSSIGTGPFSAQRSYTLVIDAPQIAFGTATLPAATYGVAFSQSLQASGGTAPYTFAIIAGALPQGITLSTAGVLAGTPAAAGTFNVTIEARDANGFAATQAFALLAAQATQSITSMSTNPTAPVFAPNGTFTVSAQGGASGNPIVFASATPAVCTVAGTTVSMKAAGRCSLTADQTGDARYTAAAQARLDVDIATAVPTLTWPTQVSRLLGEPSFDLPVPQSPSAGAFTYTSSQPGVATVSGRTVTLHGVGTTIITATQAANGNYAAAHVDAQLTVVSRPDPTKDAIVTGLLQAQADAGVRFATAEQSNIRDRLRQVRSGSNGSSSNLVLAYDGGANGQGISVPVGGSNALPAMPHGWGLWVSGTGTIGSSGRDNGFDFRTDGITLGADRAIGDTLLVGLAGSVARNNSDLDDEASHLDASQRSLAVYGLWRAGDHLFVDGVLGKGTLDFDIQRWSGDTASFGIATRGGDQWFGSLSMGYEHRGSALTLTGYGRVDANRTALDGYQESGLGLYDLAYRQQVVRNSTVAVGLEGSWHVGGDAGRVRPFWNVEYREAIDDKGDAAMNYVVGPAASDYRLRMTSYNDNALSVGAGVDVALQRGWLLSLVFGHEQARNSTDANSFGLRLSHGGRASAGDPSVGIQANQAAPRAACRGPRCHNDAAH